MIYNQPRSTSFAVILLVLMMLPIGDGVQLVMVLMMEMDRKEEDSRSWYMMQLDSPASAPA